ncbi:DinB family protein [Margalitia sp. FSL K6-0131]|uniref:DinB family protein n=1 Tax=Margalitia sp. FSL K6-0131 TaxID=2954604 RepID=UPI0030F589E8
MEHNYKIRKELLESVSDLSDQQLNTTPEEGKWSIMQNLEHLYLMEKVVVQRMTQELKYNTEPTSEVPINMLLNRSKKIDAPEFLKPSNEFTSLKEMKSKLDESREALINFVSHTSEDDLANRAMAHRLFGMLSLKQWVKLIGYHEQRHLEQIKEVKEAMQF